MLPAGKYSNAEASGQKWVQRYQTRWSWWLLLALVSTKLSKSWQITNSALRENAGIFAMPTLFSTTFSTFVWLHLKRKMLKPTAHSFWYSEVCWSLYENIQCAKVQSAGGRKLFRFRCIEEQAKKRKSASVLLRMVGPEFILLWGDTQSCPHSLHSQHVDTSKRGFPHKDVWVTPGGISVHCAQRMVW